MTQEKKINIAELLKDCPNGMELDCLLLDNVTFERVTEDGIWIKHIDSKSCECSLLLYNDGSFPIHNLGSLPTKCVIFPKGKNTWEGFVPPCRFKDGDIIANDEYIAIFHKCGKPDSYISNNVVYHCWYSKKYKDFKSNKDYGIGRDCDYRFATEEEIRKLFEAIKANGYRWNFNAKRLENLIIPNFKKGDKVRVKNGVSEPRIIDDVYDTFYTLVPIGTIAFTEQDNWELVPNKFDITTLKPFKSEVLVRDYGKKWRPAIYGFCDKFETRCAFYVVGGCIFEQCIPYEGNEQLLGTTNDCDEYYKIWK